MSDQSMRDERSAKMPPPAGAPARKPRVWLRTLGIVLLVLVVLFAGLAWYASTPQFAARVRGKVIVVLQDSIGGRVELKDFRWNLRHLTLVADGLTIHGLESADEAPYLHAEQVEISLRIVSFVSPKLSLSLVRVQRPAVHLIVYKDGSTNQPTPRKVSTSKKPMVDTVIDLAIQRLELVDGMALLNQRALPFNLAANDVQAHAAYSGAALLGGTDDHYDVTLALNDLRTRMQRSAEVHSRINIKLQLGRNRADLQQLVLETGLPDPNAKKTAQHPSSQHQPSRLEGSGSLTNFSQPQWTAAARGTLELTQIGDLVGFDGFTNGAATVDVTGHSCPVARMNPAAPVKKPVRGRTARKLTGEANKPVAVMPSSGTSCGEAFVVEAGAQLREAAYKDPYVDLTGLDVKTRIRMTPTFLILTETAASLEGGGRVNGQLHITNWMSVGTPQVPPLTAPPVKKQKLDVHATPPPPSHAVLDAEVDHMPLRTLMKVVAPKQYAELGFDTAGSGAVHAEWGDTPSSVKAQAHLKLTPTTHSKLSATTPSASAAGVRNVPITGTLVASYQGTNETVLVDTLTAQTPGATLDASGVLGVAGGDPLTNMRLDLVTRDLGEFDQLLKALDLQANGHKGVQAIPVVLHGSAQFHGTAMGPLLDLDVKGHLEAQQFDAVLDGILPAPVTPAQPAATLVAASTTLAAAATPATALTPAITPAVAPATPQTSLSSTELAGTPRRISLDSIIADAEYSPGALSVRTAVIQKGGATITVSGQAHPRRVASSNSVYPVYVWDQHTTVDTTLQMNHAELGDVLHVAGLNVPVSGVFDAKAHVAGTAGDLNGSGQLTLLGGKAYGEPYQSLTADLSVQGRAVGASKFVLTLPAGKFTGNGAYDMGAQTVRAHVDGQIELPKLQQLQHRKIAATGTVTLTADAAGTVTQPGVKALVQLNNFTLDNERMGAIRAELHSEGSTLYYHSVSNLISANFQADGTTTLTGNYDTHAKLVFSGLDIDSLLRLFAPKNITGHSSIGGTVTLAGPLALPKQVEAEANLDQFDVKLAGVDLKAAEPMRFSVHNGLLRVDQAHIIGADTDLHASGTADLLNTKAANGLNMHADGAINMALAETIDTDLTSSGHVDFTVDASGNVSSPALYGKVTFRNVYVGLEDLPNGLSQLNGTLTFDQDRLQVDKLTAMTGGGLLTLGGYMGYNNGLYADLTARGKAVRIRYPAGVSSTADADLHLQGTQANSTLSGTVLLTKFGLSQNFDFAVLAGNTGLQAPPDPNAPSSHILLDVHVTSAPQLDFQNSYAKLAGDVDLRVRGSVATPSVLGRITITEGSATFAGTQYQLQRGDIYFTNPVHIEPVIDLDASARVRDYDVTIGLHGSASNLKPTYRSEPPLPEADIFALLALGRTQEEASIYRQQEQAAGSDATTNALLGGALNATVSNRVQKLFGVGSVRIDPTFAGGLGNSAARITVEQSVSKNVTLTYATTVNATAQQLIQVEWDLTRSVSIVAVRDESGVFSLLFKVRRLYR